MSAKRPLMAAEFREICLAAAQRSSDWVTYVRQACAGLRSWLGKDVSRGDTPSHPAQTGDPEEQRVQAELTQLYPLLDECEYDFSVTGILADAQADPTVKWE
jgi:hypothetical protein